MDAPEKGAGRGVGRWLIARVVVAVWFSPALCLLSTSCPLPVDACAALMLW